MLTLRCYAGRANASNQFSNADDALLQLKYGFFGEVGGLLSAVKKAKRELGPNEKDSVMEELGDSMWYLTAIANTDRIELEEIGYAAYENLLTEVTECDGLPSKDLLTFQRFDLLSPELTTIYRTSKDQLLCKMAERAGELLVDRSAGHGPPGRNQNNSVLAKLLRDIVLIASIFDLSLAKIAESNLKKIESRWPKQDVTYIRLFDSDSHSHEQLPRKISVRFTERVVDERAFVYQQINDVNIGDRLTDNKFDPDGYRFHDVFHLAYMAHLGWSPVVRHLLKVKRKSQPEIDENEDGARARIIEEGIATWIFNDAASKNYYKDVQMGKLEYSLLKQVRNMVQGYEVDRCPLWQWEKAILCGFNVFRQLLASGGGLVHVDLDQRSITFESP